MTAPFAPLGGDPPLRYDLLGPIGTPAGADTPDAGQELQGVVKNSPAGPRWGPGGYGVVGGVPYGNSLQSELGTLQRRYRMQPRVYARLRAATRKALGR